MSARPISLSRADHAGAGRSGRDVQETAAEVLESARDVARRIMEIARRRVFAAPHETEVNES